MNAASIAASIYMMKGREMKTSAKGLALIKQFEGCRLKAYRDPIGIWTIGYGHTAAAGGIVPAAGVTISQAVADEMLVDDLVQYEKTVMSVLTRSPSQGQFDAMTSLCFNVGPKNFKGSSIVRNFNAGDSAKAANAFLLWNKAGGKVLPGLTKRRSAEMALFMSEAAPVVAAPPPKPVIAPVATPEPQRVTEVPKTDLAVPAKPAGFWARFFGRA